MDFEMPRPGPAHERLRAMCGEFVGDEVMFPSAWSPERRESTCTLSARMLDGMFVVSDYEQRIGDEVTFRGHGVYGWDPERSCYRMYWFDSMGGPGAVADGQLEGDVLTFSNTSPMGHHRYRYTFGDGGYNFEMAVSVEGADWQVIMEGRYRPK